jgi:hypothetical protein
MKELSRFKKILQETQILRAPKHRLSTFGPSVIQYTLITDCSKFPDRSRLRSGIVKAEKPLLLTPQTIKERFEGFGSEAQEYADWLSTQYGDTLKGLQYQFKNESISSRIELSPPEILTKDLLKDFDREPQLRHALLRGKDKGWELSVMKFIVEETLASFSANFQELNERGFFDGDMKDTQRQTREIQHLFKMAKGDRNVVPTLAKKLKEYGLFEMYQDEFFGLMRP